MNSSSGDLSEPSGSSRHLEPSSETLEVAPTADLGSQTPSGKKKSVNFDDRIIVREPPPASPLVNLLSQRHQEHTSPASILRRGDTASRVSLPVQGSDASVTTLAQKKRKRASSDAHENSLAPLISAPDDESPSTESASKPKKRKKAKKSKSDAEVDSTTPKPSSIPTTSPEDTTTQMTDPREATSSASYVRTSPEYVRAGLTDTNSHGVPRW